MRGYLLLHRQFIDTETGIIFGTFATSRNYTMVVKAVDTASKRALVEEYTFDVQDPPKFTVEPKAS